MNSSAKIEAGRSCRSHRGNLEDRVIGVRGVVVGKFGRAGVCVCVFQGNSPLTHTAFPLARAIGKEHCDVDAIETIQASLMIWRADTWNWLCSTENFWYKPNILTGECSLPVN